MTSLKIKQVVSLVSLSSMIIFFQNCSEMGSAALFKGQEKGTGAVSLPADQPSGGGVIVGQDGGTTTPPSGGSLPPTGGTTNPPDGGSVPPTSGSCDDDNQSGEQAQNEGDDDHTDFAAACKNLELFHFKSILVDVETVVGVHSQVIVKSDRILLVQDHSSQLVIVGHTSTAMVDKIIDVHGQTVICNAVVDRIENVTGKLVLIDTIVNNPLVGQKGKLVLIRSKIAGSK